MKRVYFILLLALTLSGQWLFASDAGALVPRDPEVRQGILSNSLSYYIRHNARPKGQADFYILSDVGAIQEDDDQQGLAHFLEHMAFNGTKNLPGKELIEYLESIGVKFGANLNASTSWDYTVYMMKDVPVLRAGVIDSALLILHDWAGFIEPQVAEIDKERGVIKEELRTRDGASWRSTMALIGALGRGTKYEERNLIGYLDYLSTFEPEALTRFYHEWYTPNHQAIIIVGDVDVDKVEAEIKRRFEDLAPAAADAPQKEVIVVADNEEPIVEIFTDPEMQYSSIQYFIKRPAQSKDRESRMTSMRKAIEEAFIMQMQGDRLDEVAMSADAPILGGGMSLGRVGVIPTMEATTYAVQAPEGEIEDALREVVEQMERTRRYGFESGEFERARQNLMSSSRNAYLNRADRTNNSFVGRYISNYRFGTPIPSAEEEWKIDSVLIATASLDVVNHRVKSLFSDDNHVVMVNAPQKEGLSVPTAQQILQIIDEVQASDITKYEDQELSGELILDNTALKGSEVVETLTNESYQTTEWILSNGVKVVVKPTTLKADEVLLYATSDGGASVLDDASYFEGRLLPYVMSQSGVADFNAVSLSRQLSGKIASLSLMVGGYEHGLNGRATPADLETLLQLVYLNFVDPRFDEVDFETFRRQMRANIENQMSDPDFIASRRFAEVAYSDNLRARPFDLEVVDGLNFSTFEAVHDKLFSDADNFRFTIVGNVDLESLKPLVERYIGSLPVDSSSKKMVYRDDNVRAQSGELRDDFTTAMEQPKVGVQMLLSGEGLEYNLRNRVVASYLNAALDDLLLKSVREELGGTYGVRANLSIQRAPYEHYSLSISYDTNEEQFEELQSTIFEQLEILATDGATAEQMNKSREFMLKNFGNTKEHNSGWLSYINRLYGDGFDYIKDYTQIVESVSSAQISQMMQTILDGGNRIEVLMHPETK
ncbi:MAG: insulinase family protein [Rikenellaceae bacterium]